MGRDVSRENHDGPAWPPADLYDRELDGIRFASVQTRPSAARPWKPPRPERGATLVVESTNRMPWLWIGMACLLGSTLIRGVTSPGLRPTAARAPVEFRRPTPPSRILVPNPPKAPSKLTPAAGPSGFREIRSTDGTRRIIISGEGPP